MIHRRDGHKEIIVSNYGSRKEQNPSNEETRERLHGINRRSFLKCSAGAIAGACFGSLLGGCGGGGSSDPVPPPTFPALVISDVHFNPFYDATLFSQLNSHDPSDWPGIFLSPGPTPPATWGADTNYPLLALAVQGVQRYAGSSPIVIFTGDILGHNFPNNFFTAYGSNDTTAMQNFANKTITFFGEQVRSVVGNAPIMFVLGNADSYSSVFLPPDTTFYSGTADIYYSHFLGNAIDQQTFMSTFTSGGYYSAEPPGMNLVVIGLNTYQFSQPFGLIYQSAINAQLDWLDQTLYSARSRGKSVWLLMHVPPGASYGQCAMTGNQITTVQMWWYSDYQTRFLQILQSYPGVVTFALGAHTHMDEYRIMSPGSVLEITPSIAPYFNNDPGFKIFTFSQSSLAAVDYTVFNYDLAGLPAQFAPYYTFSSAYSMQGLLNNSLAALYPALATDAAKQALYRNHYYSGHAYSGAFNPILDANWPIYWAGAGNVDEQNFVSAVNSY
jgi:sphingomyelin phosphodiesterase acid-like 3